MFLLIGHFVRGLGTFIIWSRRSEGPIEGYPPEGRTGSTFFFNVHHRPANSSACIVSPSHGSRVCSALTLSLQVIVREAARHPAGGLVTGYISRPFLSLSIPDVVGPEPPTHPAKTPPAQYSLLFLGLRLLWVHCACISPLLVCGGERHKMDSTDDLLFKLLFLFL